MVVVNDCWRLAPWADLLYACDHQWWAAKRPQGDAWQGGLLVTQNDVAAARYGVARVVSHDGTGLCRTPWEINQGLNSGYQALNLTYHFGVTKIVLLGYDMGPSAAGRTHWFGDHPPGMQVKSPYTEFVKRFPALAEDLQAEGVDVVNCSTKTALTCFRQSNLEVEL